MQHEPTDRRPRSERPATRSSASGQRRRNPYGRTAAEERRREAYTRSEMEEQYRDPYSSRETEDWRRDPFSEPEAGEFQETPARTATAPRRRTPSRTAGTKQRRAAASPSGRRNSARRKKPGAKARSRFAFGKVFGHVFVRRFLASVAAALLLILVVIACLRVKIISVVGNSMYSAQEVQEASGVSEGSALLLVNKTAVASRIRAELPYIDQVRVGIGLPNAVKIEVAELENTFAVAADDGSYWLINSEGKLVEQITAKKASEYLTIQGVRIQNAKAGQMVEVVKDPVAPQEEPEEEPDEEGEGEVAAPPEASAEERMAVALRMVAQLEGEDDIRSITAIDVSSIYDLQIWYGTRFQVKLGNSDELSYKLEYMVAALAQLDSYQSGVLDLTFQEAKKATFIPWQS